MDAKKYFNKYVEIKLKDKTLHQGKLLSFVDKNKKNSKDSYFLKLDNGYNIGINEDNIDSIKIITENVESSNNNKNQKVIKTDKNKPKIVLLHTGGTIASKVDYNTGAVIAKFEPNELIDMFPEIKEFANIESRRIGNMWSQDMTFEHYNIIAKEIEKEIKNGADGIIVGHGTDTMHYSSAALAFILENQNIPILFVGSQRSSDRGSSDAGDNLINAIYFMINSDYADVGICMHHTSDDDYCAILPGTRSRKMHTSRRDAFKSINSQPHALVNYRKKEIQVVNDNYKKKNDSNEKLKLHLFKDVKIAIMKQHTNMKAEQYLFYKNYDGLVIEATGLGNLPITELDLHTKENQKIFEALNNLIKKDVVIVLSPQPIYGKLNLNVYENARRQQDIGILGNFNDMTSETTFIKLAWLLSNYKKEEVKKLIMTNLRGELPNECFVQKD